MGKRIALRGGMLSFIIIAAAASTGVMASAEEAQPDLKAVYDEYCDSSWAELASDGNSLSIDSNPYDIDDYSDSDAIAAIPEINRALGLPESVYTRMGSTTSMQGVQTVDYGNLHVSWSYHPDNGIEIVYEIY